MVGEHIAFMLISHDFSFPETSRRPFRRFALSSIVQPYGHGNVYCCHDFRVGNVYIYIYLNFGTDKSRPWNDILFSKLENHNFGSIDHFGNLAVAAQEAYTPWNPFQKQPRTLAPKSIPAEANLGAATAWAPTGDPSVESKKLQFWNAGPCRMYDHACRTKGFKMNFVFLFCVIMEGSSLSSSRKRARWDEPPPGLEPSSSSKSWDVHAMQKLCPRLIPSPTRPPRFSVTKVLQKHYKSPLDLCNKNVKFSKSVTKVHSA